MPPLVARRPRHTGIVRPDQPRLLLIVCLGLAERKATLPAHTLGRAHLFDCFLESDRQCCSSSSAAVGGVVPESMGRDLLLLSGPVIGQIEFLYLLYDMIALGSVRADVILPDIVSQQTNDREENEAKVEGCVAP